MTQIAWTTLPCSIFNSIVTYPTSWLLSTHTKGLTTLSCHTHTHTAAKQHHWCPRFYTISFYYYRNAYFYVNFFDLIETRPILTCVMALFTHCTLIQCYLHMHVFLCVFFFVFVFLLYLFLMCAHSITEEMQFHSPVYWVLYVVRMTINCTLNLKCPCTGAVDFQIMQMSLGECVKKHYWEN